MCARCMGEKWREAGQHRGIRSELRRRGRVPPGPKRRVQQARQELQNQHEPHPSEVAESLQVEVVGVAQAFVVAPAAGTPAEPERHRALEPPNGQPLLLTRDNVIRPPLTMCSRGERQTAQEGKPARGREALGGALE